MGAGGIIQQRVAAVLVAITEPCFYTDLSSTAKSKVDSINAKPFQDRDAADLKYLLKVLQGLYYLS